MTGWYWLRSRVCATNAAGVASARKAVETIPTAPPVKRWKSSAMVSTLGSSKTLGLESAYTPRQFTVDLCPVYKAVAELAESVMKLSMEWVI